MGLLVAGVSAYSQGLPPVVNCITNIIISITDTNASISGTTNSQVQVSAGQSVIINYNSCPPSNRVIGSVTFTCDTSVQCGGNEGGPGSCAPGGVLPLMMPANIMQKTVFYYSFWGCCSLTEKQVSATGCLVPIGGGCP